ncbi:hypothetical protein DL93DRAFT_2071449 [Clavulina sp. PMI_390]|nr:hypothetical protein DL93DRAFT_2071449 [Clavulina sp. PMI_390]
MSTGTKKRVSAAHDEDLADSDGSDDFYDPFKPAGASTGAAAKPPPKKKARTASGTSKAALKAKEAAAEELVMKEGQELVARVLDGAAAGALVPADDTTQLLLAKYARFLESAGASGKIKPTADQVSTSVEKMRKAACSGIKKQLTWKPSCKTGSAKWTYDGIAPNPESFAALLGLESVSWKQKKFSAHEFRSMLNDDLEGHARYATLYLTSDVNIRWNPDSGEFKFSGSYGKL